MGGSRFHRVQSECRAELLEVVWDRAFLRLHRVVLELQTLILQALRNRSVDMRPHAVRFTSHCHHPRPAFGVRPGRGSRRMGNSTPRCLIRSVLRSAHRQNPATPPDTLGTRRLPDVGHSFGQLSSLTPHSRQLKLTPWTPQHPYFVRPRKIRPVDRHSPPFQGASTFYPSQAFQHSLSHRHSAKQHFGVFLAVHSDPAFWVGAAAQYFICLSQNQSTTPNRLLVPLNIPLKPFSAPILQPPKSVDKFSVKPTPHPTSVCWRLEPAFKFKSGAPCWRFQRARQFPMEISLNPLACHPPFVLLDLPAEQIQSRASSPATESWGRPEHSRGTVGASH